MAQSQRLLISHSVQIIEIDYLLLAYEMNAWALTIFLETQM